MNDNKQVSLYDFKGHQVRVVELEGNPWFVAADVCNSIGIGEKSRGYAVARLDETDRSLYRIQKGVRSSSIITESGLYKLVMRSDKQEAKAFQHWITSEVLPSIRKNGGYIKDQEKVVTGEMSLQELAMKGYEALLQIVEDLKGKLIDANAEIDGR